MEVGEEGDYVPVDTLPPPARNVSCIKMGSDESTDLLLLIAFIQRYFPLSTEQTHCSLVILNE